MLLRGGFAAGTGVCLWFNVRCIWGGKAIPRDDGVRVGCEGWSTKSQVWPCDITLLRVAGGNRVNDLSRSADLVIGEQVVSRIGSAGAANCKICGFARQLDGDVPVVIKGVRIQHTIVQNRRALLHSKEARVDVVAHHAIGDGQVADA